MDLLVDAMERSPQRELLHSSRLPTRINNPFNTEDTETIYKKWGVKVMGQSNDDPLFYDVILPNGWRMEQTNHPLWSNLVDDQDHTRGEVFFKSSIGDHDAFINLKQRFSVVTQYGDNNYTCLVQILMDNKIVIYESEVIEKTHKNYYPILHKIREDYKQILTTLYPNWEMASEYWDLTEVKKITICPI